MVRGPRHITFNGVSSESFGIIINSIDRPLITELRPRKLVVPGRDGAWDFGDNTYEELSISVNCTLVNPLDSVSLGRSIASWLSNKGKLIISDEPDKYYIGRVYAPSTQNIKGIIGTFTITFMVEPFAYSMMKTTDMILLGSGITLGNNQSLANGGNYQASITGPKTVSINNFGTKYIKPTIIVDGSFSDITLTTNGTSLTYSSAIASSELILDGSNYSVTVNGVNKLSELSGDIDNFLTLVPGLNIVNISGNNLNCTVKFDFRPAFY